MFNNITINPDQISTKSKGVISAVAATVAVFSLLFLILG